MELESAEIPQSDAVQLADSDPEGEGPSSPSSGRFSMYEVLQDLIKNNVEHFTKDESEPGQRIAAGLLALLDHVLAVKPQVSIISREASKFDFDENVRSNGYRSYIAVVDSAIMKCVQLCRNLCLQRDSVLFRKAFYVREVEAWGQLFASLSTMFQHLQTLLSWSDEGSLFPTDQHSPEELLLKAENINQYCFYGRCLGFQFCESMQRPLRFLGLAMASFSEIYYNTGGLFSRWRTSLVTGSKYVLDPELRARRIVNVSQHGAVDFCKSFWLLQETDLIQQLPGLVCPTVAINKIISVPPEPMEMPSVRQAGTVTIPIPSSHGAPRPINCRLLASQRREGMLGDHEERGSGIVLPQSAGLIIHCHGGGFVAQSSKSHEVYLRDWVRQLGVPLFSIDYSLAPEMPYPRAFEEVLYAYCWAMQHCHLLGSTAERVILVGDSAGGNLVLATALKCIELGIRPPQGLFLAYTPFLIQFIPSPSRLLCLMDPLLPFGFMMKCLKAYAGHNGEDKKTDSSSSSPPELLEKPDGKEMKCLPVNNSGAGSDTESFEEVSESELHTLVHGSPPTRSDDDDTLTTVSLVSPMSHHSKPEADQNIDLQHKKKEEPYPLDRYILDSDTDSEGRHVPVLRSESLESDSDEHILFEVPQDLGVGISNRISQAATRISSGISTGWSNLGLGKTSEVLPESKPPMKEEWKESAVVERPTSVKISLGSAQLDSFIAQSPTEEFHKFHVDNDPYLSPYLVSDEVLRQLPSVYMITLQFDPCLDDSVMLARRLKNLGNDVQLDVLDGLPHGFLNFSLISKEAHDGSRRCIERLAQLLQLETLS